MKKDVRTADAPPPRGAYSQGIIAGGFLFTAGFGPLNPVTGVKPDGIAEQTRQVLRNIGAVLAEAGLDFSDVVKVTAHLQEPKRDFEAYNAAYLEFFAAPLPARTTVGSQLSDMLIEIDVIAQLRDHPVASSS